MMDCNEACASLGPWGPLLFGVLGIVWGFLKEYQRSRAVAENHQLKATLSQRPPAPATPAPVVHVHMPPVPSIAPPAGFGDDEQTTVARAEPPTLPPPRRKI